ncbi:MAG: SDR family NAD(P)-dependent oxidoreductase [Myxococcaceae bacterium]
MILVTGAAGFIGAAVCERLLHDGYSVLGIDNLNDYYDPKLKLARLKRLESYSAWQFQKLDISHQANIEALFEKNHFDSVINLAAQAGVRHSISHPHIYVSSNITGFLHVLEGCRHSGVKHLVYASTSSVYGASTHYPFSEDDRADTPMALYAATKRANELMAHSYSHLYNFSTTGLRFFTVYGPWGRPDMALFKFTENILNHKPIDVYNQGQMLRNFTYIDDIVEGIVRLLPQNNQGYRIFNLGNPETTSLLEYIHEIEKNTGQKAILNLLPMQPGDISQNPADTCLLTQAIGFTPQVSIQEGVKRFVDWYKNSAMLSKSNGQG